MRGFVYSETLLSQYPSLTIQKCLESYVEQNIIPSEERISSLIMLIIF